MAFRYGLKSELWNQNGPQIVPPRASQTMTIAPAFNRDAVQARSQTKPSANFTHRKLPAPAASSFRGLSTRAAITWWLSSHPGPHRKTFRKPDLRYGLHQGLLCRDKAAICCKCKILFFEDPNSEMELDSLRNRTTKNLRLGPIASLVCLILFCWEYRVSGL